MPNLVTWTLALLMLCVHIGCGQSVGDSCTTSSQCETGQFCDTTLPAGYCTIKQCTFSGCPEEAICVSFTDFDSYCMLKCEVDSDCRENYSCIDALAEAPFCGATDGSTQ